MSKTMIGEWQVQVMEVPGYNGRKIYLYRHLEYGTEFINEQGQMSTIINGERNDNPPCFAQMNEDQLAALAEALSEKGFSTHRDSVAQGKLAATEKHLEDMRKIALHNYDRK